MRIPASGNRRNDNLKIKLLLVKSFRRYVCWQRISQDFVTPFQLQNMARDVEQAPLRSRIHYPEQNMWGRFSLTGYQFLCVRYHFSPLGESSSVEIPWWEIFQRVIHAPLPTPGVVFHVSSSCLCACSCMSAGICAMSSNYRFYAFISALA